MQALNAEDILAPDAEIEVGSVTELSNVQVPKIVLISVKEGIADWNVTLVNDVHCEKHWDKEEALNPVGKIMLFNELQFEKPVLNA